MTKTEREALEARGVCIPTYGEAEAEMAEAMANPTPWDMARTAANDPWATPTNSDPVDLPW